MEVVKKFAWFPVFVRTWRPQGTDAIVWLQEYYQKPNGEKYVGRLGFFSSEF